MLPTNFKFDLCQFVETSCQNTVDVLDNKGRNVLRHAVKCVNMTLIAWIFDFTKHDINFVNKQDHIVKGGTYTYWQVNTKNIYDAETAAELLSTHIKQVSGYQTFNLNAS